MYVISSGFKVASACSIFTARMMKREIMDRSPFKATLRIGFYVFSTIFLGLPVIRMLFGDSGNI